MNAPPPRAFAYTAGTPANTCVRTNARERSVTLLPTRHPGAFPVSVMTCPRTTEGGATVNDGLAAAAAEGKASAATTATPTLKDLTPPE